MSGISAPVFSSPTNSSPGYVYFSSVSNTTYLACITGRRGNAGTFEITNLTEMKILPAKVLVESI